MFGRVIPVGIAAVISLSAIRATADVVADWNAIMQSTLADQAPLLEARTATITQLAVFEAVNSITRRYRPYASGITAPAGASAEAAAVAAAHAVLTNYVPEKTASLDAARTASLEAIPDGRAKDDGIGVGEAAAAALIALRADDGSSPPQSHLPPSSEPGEWQLTANCPAEGGVFAHVRNMTPFGIRDGRQFRSAPPPSLRSGRYAQGYNEVKRVGAAASTKRPADRAEVAEFYRVVLGVPTWNSAVRQVAAAQGRSLTENARAFALVNMALTDGLIAVMDTKYRYTFWRPKTAIPAGDRDGNPKTQADPSFTPFIPTPCHPDYPSGHAS